MRVLVLILIGIIASLFPHTIRAVGEFKADYDVGYSIAPNGTSIVTQVITLTNQYTNLYPQQYQLVIDSSKVTDVIAYDAGGVITPTVAVVDGKTEILLTFNDRVVGLGKQLRFTLRYVNGDIAQKIGSIWEITIPGVVDDPDLKRYSVSLQVPPSFGPVAYLSPNPAQDNRWTKEQMVKGGISAAYGDEQRFQVGLAYHVDNPNVTPIETEIAIPPDTAFQKVAIESINPKPKNITRDADGNWLARYDLPSGGGIDVSVQLLIALFLSPRPDYRGELIDEGAYLQPLKYWETQNPKILDVARQYTTPRQIYDYVVSTLTYSYDRVNETPARMGAAEAISRPDQAICMEFTDLFIAIARAAGIPARENVGFAYTTNAKLRPLSLVTDVLHAWPEYYDNEQKVWIPVDPTWANTTGGVNYFDKLDFNHIVFAIHGRESDYPYPAGFYRRVGKTGKDVLVSFAPTAETSLKGILTTEINLPSRVTAGLPVNGTVIVKNDGGIAVDEAVIDIVGTPGNLTLRRIEQNLPPLSRVNIPVRLEFTNILANTQGTITVAVNGDETYRMFEIRPMYWLIIPVSIALGGILMLAWVISRRHLWIRKRIS